MRVSVSLRIKVGSGGRDGLRVGAEFGLDCGLELY